MTVSIVIPNYNGRNLLEKNLSSVFAACEYYRNKTKKDVEVIIVDDASKDTSVEFLKKLTDERKIQLVIHERNKGFSPTVNDGVKKATGEFVVLLNSDVVPEKEFLIPLLADFTSEKTFAIACMDKSIENNKEVLRGRGIGEWKRGFFIHSAGSLDKKNTLWASGGSSVFRKSIWDQLGGFTTIYSPFYWEDIDLSFRAWKSGYEVLFERRSVVTHEHEKGAILSTYNTYRIKVISYRNQFYFIWMNITETGLLISHVLWLPYHFIKAIMRGDLAFFQGFFSALLHLQNVVKWRSKNQRLFIKKDTEVFLKE